MDGKPTLLGYAASQGNLEMVTWCIEKGAKVNMIEATSLDAKLDDRILKQIDEIKEIQKILPRIPEYLTTMSQTVRSIDNALNLRCKTLHNQSLIGIQRSSPMLLAAEKNQFDVVKFL